MKVSSPSQILQFAGPVSREPGPGAGGLTLVGSLGAPPVPAQLSLIGARPPAPPLPRRLTGVTVELTAPGAILLRTDAGEWRIACATWQLHQDAGAVFQAAIPPRPTPWARRLGWRVLLSLAATAPGRALLSRLAKKSNSP